jgi:hypothetical protein
LPEGSVTQLHLLVRRRKSRIGVGARLKAEAAALRNRLNRQDAVIAKLADFKAHALSRIAAQHDEITRLRSEVQRAASIRRLP